MKRKLVVEYNEDARRDYLLGFHKRKQQRRKDAINKEEEMAKVRLKQERAEVCNRMKEKRNSCYSLDFFSPPSIFFSLPTLCFCPFLRSLSPYNPPHLL